MKTKTSFSIMAISSMLITAILYLIDNDPPYADFSSTVLEFSIISAVFFTIFSALFLISKLIIRISKV